MKKQTGFTLIELLMVLCILGVLAATIIPNVARFTRQKKEPPVTTVMHTPGGTFTLSDNLTSWISGSTLYVYAGNTTYTFFDNWWKEEVKP